MKSGSAVTDRYNVATPPYTLSLVTALLSLVGCIATLLAFLVTDLAWVWRAVAAAGVVVVCAIAVNAPFVFRWLSCQWRKARLYPALLDNMRVLESQLAIWGGTLALASELPPLPVNGVYERRNRVWIVLSPGKGPVLESSEELLVVDTLRESLVGRARVTTVDARRIEAEVHSESDPVCWGFIRQNIERFARRMPDHVAVFRERDVVARQTAFARLIQEVQP